MLDSCAYHDPAEFVNNTKLANNVKCLHLNIRSMMANFAAFVDMLSTFTFRFDFIVLSETWLNADTANLFALDGYNCFSFPRLGKIGGGVTLFVRSCWSSSVIRYTTVVSSFEFGIVAVHNLITGKKFIICGVYRPPRSSLVEFLLEYPLLCDFLSTQCSSCSHCTLIVAGDFNINLLKYNVTSHYSEFLECSYSAGLFPTVSLPTRISSSHSALIDNIFVNDPVLSGSGLIVSDITDHFLIFVAFMPQSNATSNVKRAFYRPLTADGLRA